jgi:XTP/dITP diphosphohydrolase
MLLGLGNANIKNASKQLTFLLKKNLITPHYFNNFKFAFHRHLRICIFYKIFLMKLIFATHNQNKLSEVRALLAEKIELLGLTDIGCHDEIDETATTIEGNAQIKSDHISRTYELDCFSDDTGLEVFALNGAPGVYSARYAGEQKNADDNMNKLLAELENYTDRSAQFKTVIALNLNGKQYLFTGIVRGVIIDEKRGNQGFGYDPIFIPEGHERTFAQMNMSEKAALSHRGKAVQQLVDFLSTIAENQSST